MKDSDQDVALLKDPAFLMVLLAALCKRSGGTLRFSEQDVASVTSTDALGLYQDPEDDTMFILKMVDPDDYKKYVSEKKIKRETKSSPLPRKYAPYDGVGENDDEWEN